MTEAIERAARLSDVSAVEVFYVPVDDRGEPHRWGMEGEATISAFGDFWIAHRDPQSRSRALRALSREDLRELLAGRWSDVTHVAYHSDGVAYLIPRETLVEAN